MSSLIRKYVLMMSLAVVGMCIAVDKPNVVLIFADDMGFGDVGYHGVEDIMTPAIDSIAKSGVQFTQGYVSASVCGPSRCGMLTGVYQQRFGCGENPNATGWPKPKFPLAGLPKSQPILSELLSSAGYECGMVGKWHLGMDDSLRPNARGFDFYYGFLNGSHDYTKALPEFGKSKSVWPLFRNNDMEPAYNGYLTDSFSDEAVSFIKKRDKAKPFFLYAAYNAVHHPWQVPESYQKRTEKVSDNADRKFFAAMVLAMDDGIGRILKTLDEEKVADNTIVIFLTDNGTPRGQGLKPAKKDSTKSRGGTMSNANGLRGFKGDVYEGGVRVPFTMKWPGKIKAGTVYEHPVSALDLVPTLVAPSGITKNPKGHAFDGVDLVPYLTGEKGNARPHDVLYWRRDNDYAIRKGDYKLQWNDSGRTLRLTLFNLKEDPEERVNLANKMPELAQTLQNQFDAWDAALPDNEWWGGPWNRNRRFGVGDRTSVARFNAKPPTEKTARQKVRK